MGCDTPDELRQEADRLARRGDGADAHIVRAAADAWEADQELCRRELRMADERYDALRKRLEAAEKAIRQVLADEETGKWGPDVTMVAVLRSALAGED